MPRSLADIPATKSDGHAQLLPRGIVRRGRLLLDQQIWCWGRDIVASCGNVLVAYGARRTQAPAHCEAGSLYRLCPNSSTTIVLRGYGVFCGRNSLGGMFVKRFGFLPLYRTEHRYPPHAFEIEDLPPFARPSRSRDRVATLELLRIFCDECALYESFIAAEFGRRYRSQTLTRWRGMRSAVVESSAMGDEWRDLARKLEVLISRLA